MDLLRNFNLIDHDLFHDIHIATKALAILHMYFC